MTLVRSEIHDGDTVLLRNGERIRVEGTSDSYHDRDGDHVGPWIITNHHQDRFHLDDVVEVVERNPHLCSLCGGGNTAKNPVKYPYCRNCHYVGAAAEDINRDMIADLTEWSGADTVSIWHTGGGCFMLTFAWEDAPHRYWAATDGEAQIPNVDGNPIRDGWGMCYRYFYDDDDVEGSEAHPDYEGSLVKEATVSPWTSPASDQFWNEYPKHCFSDRELADAVREDHARIVGAA